MRRRAPAHTEVVRRPLRAGAAETSSPDGAVDDHRARTTEGSGATEDRDTDRERILLTVDDLPAGWKEVPEAIGEGGDSCLDALGDAGGPFDDDRAEEAAFAAGDIGPFLAAAVIPTPAGDVLPAVDDVLVACDGTTGPTGFTTRVEPASIPALPEGALAVRGTERDPSGSGVDFTLVATGGPDRSLMVLAVTPLGEIDNSVVVAAVDAMYQRLPST